MRPQPPIRPPTISLAAILGGSLGVISFLGLPLWFGHVGWSPVWIAPWTLLSAALSPAGIDLIDALTGDGHKVALLMPQMALCAVTIARIGSIGMICFVFGRILG